MVHTRSLLPLLACLNVASTAANTNGTDEFAQSRRLLEAAIAKDYMVMGKSRGSCDVLLQDLMAFNGSSVDNSFNFAELVSVESIHGFILRGASDAVAQLVENHACVRSVEKVRLCLLGHKL
jgi:hypothetical protein